MAELKRKTNRNRTKTDDPFHGLTDKERMKMPNNNPFEAFHGLTDKEQRMMMAQNPFEALPPYISVKELLPVQDRTMLFGQYKGMPISEVIYANPEYLLWLDKSNESSFHLSSEQYDQCVRRKEQIAQEKFERYGSRPYSGCPCPAMQRISELILELTEENYPKKPQGMDTPPF